MNTPNKLSIIVQAGGRGSRLRHHTWNKPKCLVSIDNNPILYSLFDVYPESSFYIISDYKISSLRSYLLANPPSVNVTVIEASGSGTASGISTAAKSISPQAPVLLMWSDILIDKPIALSSLNEPTLFLTSDFMCRWSLSAKLGLSESPSKSNGVCGLFYFPQSKILNSVPQDGEFVRWLAGSGINLKYQPIEGLRELGDFRDLDLQHSSQSFCRFFNSVKIFPDKVVKEVIDPSYNHVHDCEKNWYKLASDFSYEHIPAVYSYSPLTLERVNGDHVFSIYAENQSVRVSIMNSFFDALENLHNIADPSISTSYLNQCAEVYFDKTLNRLEPVRKIIGKDMAESYTINGIKCCNYFHHSNVDNLKRLITQNLLTDKFTPIHGDPTFSNSLLDSSRKVFFIDPRGYFSSPGIFGDPAYDYAKLYYSAAGGYDAFNRKRFKLYLDGNVAEVLQEFQSYKHEFELVADGRLDIPLANIKLLHGLIWAGLAGYAVDDYDSILGAFFNSIYWLNDAVSDL